MKEKTQSGRSGGGRSVAAAAPGRTSGGDDTGRAGGSGVQGFGRSLPAASGPGEDVRGGGLGSSRVRCVQRVRCWRLGGRGSKASDSRVPFRLDVRGVDPFHSERERSR